MPTDKERIAALEEKLNKSQTGEQIPEVLEVDGDAYQIVYHPGTGKLVRMKTSLYLDLINAAANGERPFSTISEANTFYTANPPTTDNLFVVSSVTGGSDAGHWKRLASGNTNQFERDFGLNDADTTATLDGTQGKKVAQANAVQKLTALNKFKSDQQLFGLIEDTATPIGTHTGYINTGGGLTTNTGWTTKFYAVSPGDVSVLTGSMAANSSVGIPWVVWDNETDKNVILKGTNPYVSGSSYTYCPEGGAVLAVAHALKRNLIDSTSRISTLETDQNSLAGRTATLENQVDPINAVLDIQEVLNDVQMPTVTRWSDKFLNTSGNLQAFTGYYVDVYAVSEGQKININGTASSTGKFYVTASAVDLENETFTKVSNGTNSTGGATINEAYTVPSGVNFILITRAVKAFSYYLKAKALDPVLAEFILRFFGDSLTAGAGGTPFPNQLQTLLEAEFPGKYTVYNHGIGGENTITIGARQGGMPAMLKSAITIPADGSAVTIPTWDDNGTTRAGLVSSYNGQETRLLRQGNGGLNPCFIQGVECTIALPDTNSRNYTIKRNTPVDDDVVFPANSLIFSDVASKRNGFAGFFIGQNGGYDGTGEDLTEQFLKLVKYKGDGRYLIISSHGNGYANVTQKLTDEFGLRHLNLKEYYSTYAIYDAVNRGYLPDDGTYPTAQDLTDMGNQNAPDSLLADSIHFNSVGYRLLADLIFLRLKLLGEI